MAKILILDSWSGLGGGQKVAFDIVNNLKSHFDFFYLAPRGPYFDFYQEGGIKTFELKKTNFISTFFRVRRFLKEHKPDLVHVHGTRAAAWLRFATFGFLKRPKIIYTLHGFHLPKNKQPFKFLLLYTERLLNVFVDSVVCVSEHDREAVLWNRVVSQNKISVIPNGVNVREWRSNTKDVISLRDKYQIQNSVVFCVICRLHAPKDVETILKAFEKIWLEDNSVHLFVVGDGPLREGLESFAQTLSSKKQIHFEGYQSNNKPYYGLADVFLLSSEWEGLPIVVLEAGASRKPIIVSDYDGSGEVVQNGKTGLLFEFGFAQDLAQKMKELRDSEELRQRIGQEAFRFVLEKYDTKQMVDSYYKLYKELTL